MAETMARITDRRDHACFLLAMGLTPEECAERLQERLGLRYSTSYLKTARYLPEWKSKIDSFRPAAMIAGLVALVHENLHAT